MTDKPADDAKDKFRAALERKRGQQQARGAEAHDESKIHGAHDKAAVKRQFRRKSG